MQVRPPNKEMKRTKHGPAAASPLISVLGGPRTVVHGEHRPRAATAGCSLVQPKWRKHV
jgi:hypothetical protein